MLACQPASQPVWFWYVACVSRRFKACNARAKRRPRRQLACCYCGCGCGLRPQICSNSQLAFRSQTSLPSERIDCVTRRRKWRRLATSIARKVLLAWRPLRLTFIRFSRNLGQTIELLARNRPAGKFPALFLRSSIVFVASRSRQLVASCKTQQQQQQDIKSEIANELNEYLPELASSS